MGSRSNEAQSAHCMGGYMSVDKGQGGSTGISGYLGDMDWRVAFGLGSTGGVDVTQVQRYKDTLAPSQKTRSCKSCAHHPSPSPLVGEEGSRGKRVGGVLEGLVCA